MPKIKILDDRLVSKIAAGEVVERPASVVKELVENSIDAGAREIKVELEAGGKRRVIVSDDGRGMGADDALLAFDRHATSKISGFDDLEQVATLGFRGEALASIAAVARVELRTAEEPGDGNLVRIEGGRVRRAEPVSHPRGTRIEIASLFFNVPARRKFLKRPQTELRRCLEVVQGYALAHPELRFTLSHQGRALIETLPTSDDGKGIRERIHQVFGAALVRNLVEIPLDFITEREAVSGFVGNRETTRGRRIFVFVNRRLVRDRAVLASFYRGVREEWKSDDFPALFLFLDLEPQEVDVNVHPQKAEVRFRSPAFVDRVSNALRTTLAAARGEEPAPLTAPRSLPSVPAAWEGLGGKSHPGDAAEPWRPLPASPPFEAQRESPESAADEIRETGAAYPAQGSSGRIAQATWTPAEPRAVPLSGRSGEARPFRILGQYKGTLILLEGPDGLYLIDQHVAHERLLYERLRRSLQGESAASQALLTPLLLEVGASEAMRLEELAPALEPCGFVLSELSGNTVALTAIPTVLSIDEAEAMLQKLATSSGEDLLDAAVLRDKLLDVLAASLACRAAVKMHHPLSLDKMERLVSELFRAEQPYACPHGRPVVLVMGDAELERRFGEAVMSHPIEAALGYTFEDPALLRAALTHRSWANEHGEKENYERLEFLGDSVLGLVAARWLYDRFPEEQEGRLAKWKSFLVSAPALATFAGSIQIGPELRLGVGEARSGGSAKDSILADAVESIFGAIYLDGGLVPATEVVERFLEEALAERSRLSHADSKTRLQELAQSRGSGLPSYRVVGESGPDHRKRFTVDCSLDDEVMGTAEGGSKKAAEQRAAAAALERLDLSGDGP